MRASTTRACQTNCPPFSFTATAELRELKPKPNLESRQVQRSSSFSDIDAMVLAAEDAAKTEVFTVAETAAIHRRLTERSMNKRIAGQIRTQQNWIGGNDYNPCGADLVPAPPEEVGRMLADLCSAINDETLPPLVQAALVHAQCETIHPFHDGHGRTGRALVHVVMRRRGIAPRFLPPISVIFAGSRDRYVAGLTRFCADGVAEWIEQFAAATSRAARLARAYIDAVRALQERWRERVRAVEKAPRADATVWTIIDLLRAHPMISAPVATAVTNRAKGRVYEAIDQLVAVCVLVPLSESRGDRWWEAAGLLDLVAQLEAGELPPPSR